MKTQIPNHESFNDLFEGSFEVKLPTYGQKHSGESSQRRERIRRERVSRKMIKVRGKVERPQHTDFFHCFVALEGRKVGSPKRQVRSHLGR